MNDELVVEIKKMNKLLTLILIKDLTRNEKLMILDNSGFSPKEIANLIGTTSNTVSVSLNRLKKGMK